MTNEEKQEMIMERYTIYCTKEQTKKVLELGTPIEIQEYCPPGEIEPDWFHDEDKCYHIPTAEQMIGWLEEQDELGFHIWRGKGYYGFSLWAGDVEIKYGDDFLSRKEATLAAIDAALEYLETLKN